MNPPLDLADTPERRFQRLSAPSTTIDLDIPTHTPYISPSEAVERARAKEDPTILNTRVRQLTALVSEFAAHEEVLASVEGYREVPARDLVERCAGSPLSRDLSIYRLLDYEETRELGFRIDHGLDAYNGATGQKETRRIVGAVAAHQTIVVCNLRFVNHLANYYSRVTPASREQIYTWGVPGLLHAAKKYNASLGYRFTSFARNEIKDAIRQQIKKEKRQQDLNGSLILNEYVSDTSGTEFVDTLPTTLFIPPEDECIQGIEQIVEIINGMQLGERDHQIALGLATGLTVREIADKLCISTQAIRIRMKNLRPAIAEAFITSAYAA